MVFFLFFLISNALDDITKSGTVIQIQLILFQSNGSWYDTTYSSYNNNRHIYKVVGAPKFTIIIQTYIKHDSTRTFKHYNKLPNFMNKTSLVQLLAKVCCILHCTNFSQRGANVSPSIKNVFFFFILLNFWYSQCKIMYE